MSNKSAKDRGRHLLKLFSALDGQDQDTLLAFAEFLSARGDKQAVPAALAEPKLVPRPVKESVVAAIRRLSASYPMLDKARMLNETSSLMTQHVMKGRTAAEVIDDLEALFSKHYERYRQEFAER